MENIISYFKDRYEEENSRFVHIETKCSIILRFLTIVIGVIGAIVSINNTILTPSTFMEWIKFILLSAGTISIVFSWTHAFTSIRIGNYPVVPKNRETAEYLIKINEEEGKKHILNCYIDTIKKITDTIDEKAKNLNYSYKELSAGVVLFWILMITSVIMEMIK